MKWSFMVVQLRRFARDLYVNVLILYCGMYSGMFRRLASCLHNGMSAAVCGVELASSDRRAWRGSWWEAFFPHGLYHFLAAARRAHIREPCLGTLTPWSPWWTCEGPLGTSACSCRLCRSGCMATLRFRLSRLVCKLGSCHC